MTEYEKTNTLAEALTVVMEMLTAENGEERRVPTKHGSISLGWYKPQESEQKRYIALLQDSRYECWDKVLNKKYHQPLVKIYVGVDPEVRALFIEEFVKELDGDNPPEEIEDVGFKKTAVFVLKKEYRNVKEQTEDSQE